LLMGIVVVATSFVFFILFKEGIERGELIQMYEL
jgi:hypothetical protein